MDYGICNVRTYVNACDCTLESTDTRKRVCTENWLWEKNPLPHRGIEPSSAAWRSDALTNWAASHIHIHEKSIPPSNLPSIFIRLGSVRKTADSSLRGLRDGYRFLKCYNYPHPLPPSSLPSLGKGGVHHTLRKNDKIQNLAKGKGLYTGK